MMDKSNVPDTVYRAWLVNKVPWQGRSRNSYHHLFQLMHEMEYTWVPEIPLDQNRALDGKELRGEFLAETGSEMPDYFLLEPCSVLEMLVALAKRTVFDYIGDPNELNIGPFFWEMIGNLGLLECSDQVWSGEKCEKVKEILLLFLSRNNKYGRFFTIFPVSGRENELKRVEIWSQMLIYISG